VDLKSGAGDGNPAEGMGETVALFGRVERKRGEEAYKVVVALGKAKKI